MIKKFDFGESNKKQKKAIMATEGPLLLIAGPGTGKTATLVKRIAYLVVEKHVKPEEIMMVTFTEKAAKELITRVTNELKDYDIEIDINQMYIGTFHAIALRILKENIDFIEQKKNFRNLDEFDAQYLVYTNLYSHRNRFPMIDELYEPGAKISKWKKAKRIVEMSSRILEEINDIEKLKDDKEEDVKIVYKIVNEYEKLLKDKNAIDFTHILTICYKLLSEKKEILEKIKSQIKYIMVDEYQDTNRIQEKIILKLLNKNNNICVVGDDDQGLYRFRAATISNILNFSKNFKTCEIIKLEENYRSNSKIIDLYNNFMKNPVKFKWNGARYDKEILNSKRENDSRNTVLKCYDSSAEVLAKKIAGFIKMLKKENIIADYNQVAFLANSVGSDKPVEIMNVLESKGINVYSPRSKQFFERDEIILAMTILKMCFPERLFEGAYISNDTKEFYNKGLALLDDLKKKDKNTYNKIIAYMEERKQEIEDLEPKKGFDKTKDNFTEYLYDIFSFEPFATFLDTKNVNNVHDERPIRNLAKLTQITSKYEKNNHIDFFTLKNIDFTISNFFYTYINFLLEGGINEYEDEKEIAPSGCVTFLTIHQSKGLEFPIVFTILNGKQPTSEDKEKAFITNIIKRYVKIKSPEKDSDIKYYDYYRLYYTAFSRAQALLVLTYVKDRQNPKCYFLDILNKAKDYNTVNLKGLKTKLIEKADLKDSYSFTSSIEVYDRCPMQYKFFHDLEFAEVKKGSKLFGSLVHQTIEDVHKAAMNGQEFTNEDMRSWFDVNYDTLSKQTYSHIAEDNIEMAFKQVERYVEKQKDTFKNIRDAEKDVSLIKKTYILKGTIDLINGKDNTVEIVDFKSLDREKIENNKELLDSYRRQLEVYAHILKEKEGLEVSKVHLYCTAEDKSDPRISFDVKETSIANTMKSFDDTVKKIQNREYSKRACDKKVCSNCNMKPYCDKRRKD